MDATTMQCAFPVNAPVDQDIPVTAKSVDQVSSHYAKQTKYIFALFYSGHAMTRY